VFFKGWISDIDSETMSAAKRHYAIRKKVQLFGLFDQGKRPSDIADAPVTRKTLYQYYGEWRKERGVAGRQTGFAIKKFSRRAYLEAKENERRKKEKETIARLVMGWEAILEALKGWDGDLEHTSERIYLPGSRNYRWLRHALRMKRDAQGRSVFMTREENLTLHEKWVECGRKAQDKADFKRFCREEGVGLPAEIKE
jgi:hypothetical protein